MLLMVVKDGFECSPLLGNVLVSIGLLGNNLVHLQVGDSFVYILRVNGFFSRLVGNLQTCI